MSEQLAVTDEFLDELDTLVALCRTHAMCSTGKYAPRTVQRCLDAQDKIAAIRAAGGSAKRVTPPPIPFRDKASSMDKTPTREMLRNYWRFRNMREKADEDEIRHIPVSMQVSPAPKDATAANHDIATTIMCSLRQHEDLSLYKRLISERDELAERLSYERWLMIRRSEATGALGFRMPVWGGYAYKSLTLSVSAKDGEVALSFVLKDAKHSDIEKWPD